MQALGRRRTWSRFINDLAPAERSWPLENSDGGPICFGMTDSLTPTQRSHLMSRIRSRDTKPEMAVRRALHGMGFRYRLHRRDLPGSPDIVLPRWNAIVLVHGCFFHGHSCLPQSRSTDARRSSLFPVIAQTGLMALWMDWDGRWETAARESGV
jgi:DNA mismatch endonuclease Vsr